MFRWREALYICGNTRKVDNVIDTMEEESLEAAIAPKCAMEAIEDGWHDKLHMIFRRINLAKNALAQTRLNGRQAGLANKLIREIEQSVNSLDQVAVRQSGLNPAGWISSWFRIDGKLDDLGLLCDQLLMAVHGPRH